MSSVSEFWINDIKAFIVDLVPSFNQLFHSRQSYKQFTLVIYESRVVIWGIFKSGTTLESVVIYERRGFLLLTAGSTLTYVRHLSQIVLHILKEQITFSYIIEIHLI